MTSVDLVRGETVHIRKGAARNAFKYRVDYILLDPEHANGTLLFSRNKPNLTSLHDSDHGGPAGYGRGADWLRKVLLANGLSVGRISLLTQPRVLGHVFNPVSFWLVHDDQGGLRVVVAEVTNTYGDRHSYLCHRDDCAAITADDRLIAQKLMHVSPFQPVAGAYAFRFDIGPKAINIVIDYSNEDGGVIATLSGARVPLTNRAILAACLQRPFGSRRVLALIHWQAVKLWFKGASFRARPLPPKEEVTR